MRRFTLLLLTLAIILVAGNVSANEWTTPGADPTLVSWPLAIPQLKSCPIEVDRMVSAVQTNHGIPIFVKRGEYFSEMTGGSKLYSHEFAAFKDSIVAYSWRFITTNSAGWIELVIFPKCGNAAWRYVPMCPEEPSVVIGLPVIVEPENDSGFPWGLLGLLGLLGLFGLSRRVGLRGQNGQNGKDGKVLYVQPDGSTSETRPESIEIITIQEDADKLSQLKAKKSEFDGLNKRLTELTGEIEILTEEIRKEIDPPVDNKEE